MVIYFEKKSTRTRLSCTRAWTAMGGSVIDMSPQGGNGSHIGVSESLYDSFRVIAGMADCILARVDEHDTLLEICRACDDAKKATAGRNNPMVINALSDKFHPLQILADMMTIYENELADYDHTKPIPPVMDVLTGKTVTWVGDSNNVFNSLMTTLPRFGMKMRVCTPPEYPIRDELFTILLELDVAKEINDESIMMFDGPVEALENCDYVVTDTWISMGDEKDKEERIKNFDGYQINEDLMKKSKPHEHWKFLHCLPRKKEEVTDDIFYGEKSLVFSEAENRMWTAMSLFYIMTTMRH